MISLEDRRWKLINLSEIFSSITRGKISDLRNLEDGNTVVIAAAGVNEGFACFSNSDSITSNAMTISLNGVGTGTAFVHNYPFNMNSDCGLVKTKEKISIKALQFISVMINNNKDKFNYGYKANETRLLNLSIKLPINGDGDIDYEFMELYMQQMESNLLNKEIDYVESKLKEIGPKKDVKELYKCNWKKFNVKDIFETIQRGKRLKTAEHISGYTPYVSSTALNNGVDRFIGNKENVREFENCLSLANSGSVGSCFYEPFNFIASDHITHLKNNSFNKYHYLFMATMLSRLSDKYNFNREINDARISKEIILLPIKNDNTPDYDYMEQYIKNIMVDKYNKLLNFIKQ